MHSTRGEPSLEPCEGVLEKAEVEAGVVRHEHGTGKPCGELVGEARKAWGAPDHRIGDSGQRLDGGRDRHFRVDQRRPFLDPVATGCSVRFYANDADLADAVPSRMGPGGFQVDNRKRVRVHGGIDSANGRSLF